MAIIVFQHEADIGPGRLGATLRDHGFKLDIRRLDAANGEAGGTTGVPPDFDNVEAVVSLGGEANVGDTLHWMEPELAYLREAHRRQLPVIGICLGSQLIAHALGGKVGHAERPEWGFRKIGITIAGQTDTILSGIPWDSHQFSAHNQEVKELPPGATALASSADCNVQAFRAGLRTYAFQYHFECDRAMIEGMVAGDRLGPPLDEGGTARADLMRQCDTYYRMFARLADRLAVNLTTYLLPLQLRTSA